MNFANTKVLHGVLPYVVRTKEAVMNKAVVPIPSGKELLASNLALGQYRHNIAEYLDDPLSFLVYPVFDSFEDDRKVAGVLATNIYWRVFFTEALSPSATGIVCVLENSFNQTLAYRIDGRDVTFLGEEDIHDSRYDYMEESANINSYVESQARPETRSYSSVPLNMDVGRYTLRIYPSRDTEGDFSTNNPVVYTIVVASTFLFTSIVFVMFAVVVERRQHIVMARMLKTASKAAVAERDLNEFLAHEVRNPLAAAISAHSFVASSVKESLNVFVDDSKENLQGDIKIIGSSLRFIDDFLRSMLDMYRAAANKLAVKLAPTDLLKDVLEPVRNMFYQRDVSFEMLVDCPEHLVVATDCLRLKQIMLNLGRNSSKFVQRGFVRFRAAVVDGLVELYVEDSGPGIPVEKRNALFEKFQSSLDELAQGTGIGLSLCKNLSSLMGGDIWLDEKYDSGVEGSPGARFVIQLNQPPLAAEEVLNASKHGLENGEPMELEEDRPSQEKAELRENLAVLFVDDDLVLRKLFVRSLKRVAPTWRIEEAANGETALRLAGEKHYDLVFMDQYMASTEKQLLGTETVRALRARNVSATICGLSANDLEDAFIGAGADFFILKPMPCEQRALKQKLFELGC